MSLDKLKRVRRGHRAFVTKTIQGVNEVCQSYNGTLLEKERLQSWKSTLADKKSVLKQQDDAIMEQLDKDEDINGDIFWKAVNLNELVKFWDLETLGIQEKEPSVYDKFTQEVHFNGDRYEAKLPFKDEHPLLPDNYSICEKRLGSLIKRLRATPSVLQEYHKVIEDQLNTGVVELVEEVDGKSPGHVHYLPHKEVVRNDKDTTKLRVVYDASAKKTGPSLNDCLYVGPPLTPLIFNILTRFRIHPVAVTADIEKAFLNIAIAPEHRDYLRFLWVDDPSSEAPQIQVLRFTRVVFGLTSSPFILNATLKHHLNQYAIVDPQFVEEVLRSLYVDDLASGSRDVPSAVQLTTKVKTRLSDGGFNMRKWNSNSQELIETLQENSTFSKAEASVDLENYTTSDVAHGYDTVNEASSRVLGQIWNTYTDELIMDFAKVLSDADLNNVTKRIILSTAAKFFDPLGLISPVILMFKLLFQQLCKSEVGWDETLNEDMIKNWQSIVKSLEDSSNFSLNRCYCKELFADKTKSIQLHAFGDASESSYGACVYLRCEHEADVHCNLIASKTRVAPMTNQTIPRLELLSCLLASRLLNSVKEAIGEILEIESDNLWSDSTTALHWIKNTDKEYKVWVQNRVSEIRKLTSVETWRYCPTQFNPADVASRGALATQLINDEKWWHGPSFLQNPQELWPVQPGNESKDNPDYCQELKLSSTKSTTALVTIGSQPEHNLEELIDPSRYSRIGTILRVTAYVIRFVRNLQRRQRKSTAAERKGSLTADEINIAEKMWIRQLQSTLPNMKDYKKVKESLSLFENEDKIIRCRGRIDASPLPYGTKFPILLPSDHYITRLIIMQSHEDVIHNGERETLTQLRSKFWVTKGRQVVKKIISKCTVCRKLEGKSYGTPASLALPDFRLSNDFAFTRIGVDYAGPFYVRDIYTQSKDMHKTYIALYTCASSRAIHLDLVPDNTTQSFVKSLKRFIGRRGIPSLVISDNAKTFKGAELRNFIAVKNIRWQFIVERSPWWGGFYERMVRCVKRCLKKVLSNARLTYEELLTLLIQIEGVLNSRPLTYVSNEKDEPLTPSQLVIGRRIVSVPSELQDDVKIQARNDAIKRDKYLKTVLGHFWKRWSSEYLTQLREHHRPSKRDGPVINVGDVVSVKEDNVKRLNWEMALVDELIQGKDGKSRAAVVRMIGKDGKVTRLRLPLQKLYPIELQSELPDEKKSEFPITFVKEAKQENIDI
ncbi:uncharacterized protein LOC114521030 [Dendronephthya gigantea]|uniref:uncharacterized protein LOC114521030 n=1 Tax=Dendronephthya gigantea TaxID=151771 RepID=UPI00106D35F0|nr:uncharacterized protein LOC114521030 [Dendronephthya gigantea]